MTYFDLEDVAKNSSDDVGDNLLSLSSQLWEEIDSIKWQLHHYNKIKEIIKTFCIAFARNDYLPHVIPKTANECNVNKSEVLLILKEYGFIELLEKITNKT